jgi:HSP20 family protein
MSNHGDTSTEVATDREPVPPQRDDQPVIIQRPPLSTHEDENGVHLQVALPGVRKEDLRLSIHESNLQIQAPRSNNIPEGWKTHRDGGGAIRYELNARLTNRLDGSKAEATLEDGILKLHLPLREEAKPREIQVS